MKRGFVILMAAILLAVGCAKAPAEDVTAKKNTDRLVEMASADTSGDTIETQTLAERFSIPDNYRIDETYSDGRLTIAGDALITLPDASSLPVVKVTPADFSQETIDCLYTALVGDTPMFQQQERLTKREIEQQIQLLKQTINNPNSAQGARKQAEQQMDALEKAYASAYETVPYITAGTQIVEQEHYDPISGVCDYTYYGVNLAENPGQSANTGITFYVQNNAPNGSIQMNADEFGETVIDTQSTGAVLSFHAKALIPDGCVRVSGEARKLQTLQDVPTEYQDAIRVAENLLEQASVHDMRPVMVRKEYTFASDAVPQSNTKNRTEYMAFQADVRNGKYDNRALAIAIVIDFARTISNVTVTSDGDASYVDDKMVGAYWRYEQLAITVGGGSVQHFYWTSPHEITSTVSLDAEILPLEEVDEVMRATFPLMYRMNDAETTIKCNVTQVVLSLRRIIEQNSLATGLLVPVWDFYGTFDRYSNGELIPASAMVERIMTVNAIDGSIVDIERGF